MFCYDARFDEQNRKKHTYIDQLVADFIIVDHELYEQMENGQHFKTVLNMFQNTENSEHLNNESTKSYKRNILHHSLEFAKHWKRFPVQQRRNDLAQIYLLYYDTHIVFMFLCVHAVLLPAAMQPK